MTTQITTDRQQTEDRIGEDVLDTVLRAFGYSRAVLLANRSTENVLARARIFAAMRACRHPDTLQLSLRCIARVCGTTPATILHQVNNHARRFGAYPAWKFYSGPGVANV